LFRVVSLVGQNYCLSSLLIDSDMVNIVMFLSSSITTGYKRLDLTNILSAFQCGVCRCGGLATLAVGWGVPGLSMERWLCGVNVLDLLVANSATSPEITLNPLLADYAAKKNFWRFKLANVPRCQAYAANSQPYREGLPSTFCRCCCSWIYSYVYIASDIALKSAVRAAFC